MPETSNRQDERQDLQRKRLQTAYHTTKPLVQRPHPKLLQTELKAEITIQNTQDVRCGQTATIPIYRIGHVAEFFGVSTQSVRQWEERGIMPKPTLYITPRNMAEGNPVKRDADRGYTFDQMRLMWELFPLRNFSTPQDKDSPFWRELRRLWALMPDGVTPQLTEGDFEGARYL